MQPGSSVATSLVPGEAVPKHVAILSITGKDFKVETIRLKTVRPFVMREIVLAEEKGAVRLAKKANNRSEVTRFLEGIVHEMIEQANEEWEEAQAEEDREEDRAPPLPLIRLRVEHTAPEGGNFECENPQRFSNRFVDKVANRIDVVQFYRKRKVAGVKRSKDNADLPEEEALASLGLDTVKVEKLVREFLTAQSLTILPQNSFGDAVSQFVDKDDKHAMEAFVDGSLSKQVDSLVNLDHVDEDNLQDAINESKSRLEELFASGKYKLQKSKRKPKPAGWDSEMEGPWDDQLQAIDRSGGEDEEDSDATPAPKPAPKGRGKAAAPKKAAPVKKAAPAKNSRSKKTVVEEDSEEEEEDIVMIDSDKDESQSQLFVTQEAPPTRGSKKAAPAKKTAPPAKRAPARTVAKQSQLNFSQPATQARGKASKAQEMVEDISDDDDDAFEPAPAPSARSTRTKR